MIWRKFEKWHFNIKNVWSRNDDTSNYDKPNSIMSIIYVKQTSLCAQYVCLESSLNLECMGVSPYKYRLSLYGLDFTLYKF